MVSRIHFSFLSLAPVARVFTHSLSAPQLSPHTPSHPFFFSGASCPLTYHPIIWFYFPLTTLLSYHIPYSTICGLCLLHLSPPLLVTKSIILSTLSLKCQSTPPSGSTNHLPMLFPPLLLMSFYQLSALNSISLKDPNPEYHVSISIHRYCCLLPQNWLTVLLDLAIHSTIQPIVFSNL